MLKLFYSPGACSIVSHIALYEAGAEFEAVRVMLSEGEQLKPEYLAINPHGRVPALATDEAAHDAVIQGGRAALLKHFDEIDGKCGDGWIAGGKFTAADSYLLIFFRWGKRLEFDMARYASWAALVDRVLDRPAVARTLEAEGWQRSDFTVS